MGKFSPNNLAWTALIGNVIVILQGAFVRASGSGAGCGRHWPMCNGEVIPLGHGVETLIEFSHRGLSGMVLILGAWLLAVAFRCRKQQRGFFIFALVSFIFLIIEALLGAGTVLLGLTGDNVSMARGLMVATHLVNSMLLVGALSLTVVFSRPERVFQPHLRQDAALSLVLLLGLGSMLLLMFSGGIAAMGNTMFPPQSLGSGLVEDFASDAHPLVRLRILHPIIGITVGIYLFLSLGLGWWMKPLQSAKRVAQILLSVYVAQTIVGFINLGFLAPIFLQLIHLALAVAAFSLLSAYSGLALFTPLSAAEKAKHKVMKEARA